MRIRRFRDGDEDAVVALWVRTGIAQSQLDLHAEIREKRRRDRSLFLVAVDGAVIVGAVMGAYDGRRGWVYHLAVDPAQQRDGCGSALMEAVERAMVRIGVTKANLQVRADNRDVIGFYERLGYAEEPRASLAKRLPPPPSDRT
ncbi:MAG: hypothetical protein QOF51_1876 [Chloroflexota bacterium]|jgi:ribosomal protein S18 acetylase RimI-like enzyme|nr:hypothetical protein [Chloroflexota bacterium]